MNRRSFFSMLTHGSTFRTEHEGDTPRPVITAGLEAYSQPLSRSDASHLLRRLTFAPTHGVLSQIVGKSAEEAVDMLLGDGKEPDPTSPGKWVDEAQEDPYNVDIVTRNSIEAIWKNNFARLQEWWVEIMRSEALPAREKLTLLWSGHFTSEFTYDLGYIPPQLLYRQNLMLRKNRLSNLKTFAEEVTVDAAMLVYLGGVLNVKGKPNENYGRELMELFTCGIGWYTEGDVKEAARILTGWKASLYSDAPAPNGLFNSYFSSKDHDIGAKQYMGQSIPARDDTTNTEFLVRSQEIGGLLNILFTERADAVGTYIANKLYRYFVYSNPSESDAAIISALRDLFKQNDFQLRPVLKALLSSAHFFDAANRGAQIKTPAEYVVGLGRQLDIRLSGAAASMKLMEQEIMDPPNVSGWEGYRSWISTKTYPQRTKFARDLITSLTDAQAVVLIKQFPDYTDVNKLVTAMTEYYLPMPVSQARHDNYVKILLNNAPDYEWGNILKDAAACGTRFRGFLNALVKAPDFHLC